MYPYTCRTPGGNDAVIWCREGTNDQMTAEIDIEQDRYRIADLPREGGVYVDIGTHIGTWAVAALTDDPDAKLICVEPLTENVKMTRRNLAANGLEKRLIVIHAAAFVTDPDAMVPITWGFRSKSDPERAAMHRYIGGFDLAFMPDDVEYDTVDVPVITWNADLDVAVLKVAGETSERALVGADLSRVAYIIGKFHHAIPELVPHLRETHEVTTYADRDNPEPFADDAFGWYQAARR